MFWALGFSLWKKMRQTYDMREGEENAVGFEFKITVWSNDLKSNKMIPFVRNYKLKNNGMTLSFSTLKYWKENNLKFYTQQKYPRNEAKNIFLTIKTHEDSYQQTCTTKMLKKVLHADAKYQIDVWIYTKKWKY